MTNGKQWRLYSRHAHARATNFYEVDLVEALAASGDTDPNEAFRYWWLFFRADAFRPAGPADAGCWLDAILQGSRDFAKKLGENLKDRIFYHVFKDLAAGFLADRKGRLGQAGGPTRQELDIVFEATLTLLYRLLFLLTPRAATCCRSASRPTSPRASRSSRTRSPRRPGAPATPCRSSWSRRTPPLRRASTSGSASYSR